MVATACLGMCLVIPMGTWGIADVKMCAWRHPHVCTAIAWVSTWVYGDIPMGTLGVCVTQLVHVADMYGDMSGHVPTCKRACLGADKEVAED